MSTARPLVHLNMDDDLIARIDDYRFSRRFPSRAATIKRLLEWALEQNPDLKP